MKQQVFTGSVIGFQQEISSITFYAKGYLKYCVSDSMLQKLFWITVVLAGFSCASLLVFDAVSDWIKNPSGILVLPVLENNS